MIRFLTALALIFATSPALASCSCDIAIPVPGQYKITGPDFTDVLTLEVGTGEDGSCGSAVVITSAPGGHLQCEGTIYRGIIPGNAEGRPPQEMVLIPNQALPGNHPPNHALDEVEAYQVTRDSLEPWYAESCS